MNLYEITSDYVRLMEMAEDPDLDPEILRETMEELDGELEEKAENYAKVIKEMESRATALKAESDRLTARRKAIENGIDRMKRNLEASMIATGKRKFKTDLFSFNIQPNPPKVVFDEDYPIPEEFLIPQDPKINTEEIKKRLKDGEELKFAKLEQGESIRIR